MRKYLLLVAMSVAMVFASIAAANSSPPDQGLADALVVQQADGPTYWTKFKPAGGVPLGCRPGAAAATARSRSTVGGVNTWVHSLATVFPDRRQAHLYYRHALVTVA
jgi:hypothetical protein